MRQTLLNSMHSAEWKKAVTLVRYLSLPPTHSESEWGAEVKNQFGCQVLAVLLTFLEKAGTERASLWKDLITAFKYSKTNVLIPVVLLPFINILVYLKEKKYFSQAHGDNLFSGVLFAPLSANKATGCFWLGSSKSLTLCAVTITLGISAMWSAGSSDRLGPELQGRLSPVSSEGLVSSLSSLSLILCVNKC